MTQAGLDFTPLQELVGRSTYCARLAAYLLERRGMWIDGLELAKVGGAYAFRTRLSDLRRAPWHLTIENRQRRTEGGMVISEYRLA